MGTSTDHQPVYITITRACVWSQKTCGRCYKSKTNAAHRKPDKGGICVFLPRLRCANCDLPKAHHDHLGQPPSWNIFGSGSPRAWQGVKSSWSSVLKGVIEESGLPKGLSRVLVEGEVVFPRPMTDKGPDQGNFRAPLEKILGDVLEEGGWIPNDNWACYEFGNLTFRHQPGVSATRLTIMPL